ncbi:hypothetical protein FIBSPDRAFT_964951 [Athelia psychrophila]|uniref:Uncharacterized protein n=1 Tax=Athelia psychrophila TaxID=1759441 RepID=A0A165X6S8_9AGAM|nr:hypothetical protein FIBSPDRAFT_964951 [Fibularhizoctonia sp. CBS 109695]
MDTAKGLTAGMQDVSMATARSPWNDDIQMQTARAGTTMKAGGFQMWERELLESPEIRRKSTVAQLYFLDFYFQTLGYLSARKERRQHFDKDTAARALTPAEYTKEFKSYCGREREKEELEQLQEDEEEVEAHEPV